MEKAARKSNAGRPAKDLDVEQIKRLAMIHCTMTEIAAVMKCSVDTLERNFADIIKDAKEEGKSSLRRAQYKKAMSGHPSMLIWMGKHLLDQKEDYTVRSTFEPEARALFRMWDKKE
jgi:hypothetical protein